MSLIDDPADNIKYDGACPICHGDLRICNRADDCPLRSFRWDRPADWQPVTGEMSAVTINPGWIGDPGEDS